MGGVFMEFKLVIDKDKPEEIVATVHDRSPLTDEIEALITKHTGRIPGYRGDEIKMLSVSQIACITVKTKAFALSSGSTSWSSSSPPALFASTKALWLTRMRWIGLP